MKDRNEKFEDLKSEYQRLRNKNSSHGSSKIMESMRVYKPLTPQEVWALDVGAVDELVKRISEEDDIASVIREDWGFSEEVLLGEQKGEYRGLREMREKRLRIFGEG